MKKSSIIKSMTFGGAAAIIVMFAAPVHSSRAAAPPKIAKLPYAKGQSFLVTQGYNTPPTHIKKDSYALDFTQNGCDAYGKAVVAAASGTAMFVSQEGYNGGYGTELIIDHGNDIVSRYAHMVPGSIAVATSGTAIRQGETIGLLGDTGLVVGAACAEHPGTHLHFAMDTVNADGTFSALDPEPISGYTNVTAGNWYLSDNEEDDVDSIATTSAASATTSLVIPVPQVPMVIVNGGVPASNVSVAPADVVVTSTPDAASTTDPISTSTIAAVTTTTSVATSSPFLFTQPDDTADSTFSFYDDNWFELGNGFSGTLNALTLKGRISNQEYLGSQVSLQEFKDKNYTAMVQEFPIANDLSFSYAMATATFGGLSIPLKPYFYYRLFTVQGLQNRSVILAGTTTTATGTAMWDIFAYGAGRVEYTEPFFPFMVMEGVAATSTLTPPPLTTPTHLTTNFDMLGMAVSVAFGTSTDPDWPANPLHYEMNYSTSTSLSDAGWFAPAPIPVAMGNSYLIGVRAKDNYGNISAVATTTWNFPAGFTPYLLSPVLSYASQYFTVPSTSTLQSITLFTTNFVTNARYPEGCMCSLEVFDAYNLSSVGATSSDNSLNGYGCVGTPTFTFTSSPFVLYPSHEYHWGFMATTGNPSTVAGVQFYGTAMNTAGGAFSDPSLANARFIIKGDTGVLFQN